VAAWICDDDSKGGRPGNEEDEGTVRRVIVPIPPRLASPDLSKLRDQDDPPPPSPLTATHSPPWRARGKTSQTPSASH